MQHIRNLLFPKCTWRLVETFCFRDLLGGLFKFSCLAIPRVSKFPQILRNIVRRYTHYLVYLFPVIRVCALARLPLNNGATVYQGRKVNFPSRCLSFAIFLNFNVRSACTWHTVYRHRVRSLSFSLSLSRDSLETTRLF